MTDIWELTKNDKGMELNLEHFYILHSFLYGSLCSNLPMLPVFKDILAFR